MTVGWCQMWEMYIIFRGVDLCGTGQGQPLPHHCLHCLQLCHICGGGGGRGGGERENVNGGEKESMGERKKLACVCVCVCVRACRLERKMKLTQL